VDLFSAGNYRSIYYTLPFSVFLFVWSCAPFHRNEKADYYRAHPNSLFFSALQHSLRLRTFDGSAQIAVESPQGNFNGLAQVYYQQPDSLLIQIRAGFGISVGNLLSVGDRIWIHNVREHILYQGRGADVSLNDLVGVKLRVGNLVEAALGLPKPPLTYGKSLLQSELQDGNIYFSLADGDMKWEYLADPEREVFLRYTIIQTILADTIQCVFRQFRRLQQNYLPQHIQISHLHQRERLSLFYTDTRVNKKLPRDRFRLKMAKDVEVINLTQEGYGD